MVPVEVTRVAVAPSGQAVVILRAPSHGKLLPIWIGSAEANAIQIRLDGRKAVRPLTHDLLGRVLTRLGARLVKVHVEDLRDRIFYGRIFLTQGRKKIDIDARPSDSIALAVGAKVPVLVSTKVLDAAGVDEKPAAPTKKPSDTTL